jgi:hypothetical protein
MIAEAARSDSPAAFNRFAPRHSSAIVPPIADLGAAD